jgi:hypothetical protein
MKLTLTERIALLGILPAEGTYANMKTVRVLREMLAFDSDIEAGKVEVQGNNLRWKENYETEFDLSGGAIALIHDILSKLDEEAKVTDHLLTLCDKFLD